MRSWRAGVGACALDAGACAGAEGCAYRRPQPEGPDDPTPRPAPRHRLSLQVSRLLALLRKAVAQSPSYADAQLALGKRSGRRAFPDKAMTALASLAGAIAFVPLAGILFSVVQLGLPEVLAVAGWTQDLGGTTDRRAGGGALAAIVGTLEIGLITALVPVPDGVFGAIFLIEYERGPRSSRVGSFMGATLPWLP